MRPNRPEEFLGIDFGQSRVGIARGSSLARLAEPLKTVTTQEAIAEITAFAAQLNAVGIVIGLPRSLEGKETTQTKSVRQWVNMARSNIRLPFYWQDEALTSRLAETDSRSGNKGTDAAAAAIILQDFLDTPKVDRVKA